MADRITTYLRNNVLGLVAIFIALSAGAYAAGLPRNSVKSKQIKAGAVKNEELADDAVTSPKVANGSLRSEDFAAGQLPSGPQGEQGPMGEQGPQGPQGVQGLSGTARAYARVASHVIAACSPNCFFDRSKGITQVTRLNPGDYCVRAPGLSPHDVTPVVSVDWEGSLDPVGNASVTAILSGGCPAGDFTVNTQRQPLVPVRDAANIGTQVVSGLATDADDVGFAIIIP